MNLFKKLYRILKWLAILILFLLVVLGPFAGNFLVIHENPQKSDVIIVLSGGSNNLNIGIELYEQKYAPQIMVSNALDYDTIGTMEKRKIPSTSVIFETKADSTYTNAIYTKDLMIKHRLNSAIIVTPDYHMRRVKYHFDKVYKGTGITFTYTSVETQTFHPHQWWLDNNSRRIVINEYIKFVGNILGFEGNEYKKLLFLINLSR
ncbi:YdcF family protein [Paenibacillus timonensis]|uniref:YdcF family protein n=1 Tax=Paenibacillus timonensis TaxID=225915 RepID=A0ABW3SC16_9BACL|nr:MULTISPECIES: YdcF family protein [Paenibacillus]MCH1640137.1 YdcF family protein [Paenibacillus timonensis]MDU2242895.1 YdcF family protein [Paenibacillus sp.]